MRFVLFICIVMSVVALGLNWGGMLSGIGSMIAEGGIVMISMLVVVAVVMAVFMRIDRMHNLQDIGVYSDFSVYAVVSTGAAVAITVLLFSDRKSVV